MWVSSDCDRQTTALQHDALLAVRVESGSGVAALMER
jgi:hypothetical protein